MAHEPESFETTEYGTEHEHPDARISSIQEIVTDIVKKNSNQNLRVSFSGNLVKLTYHCYEMFLPTRLREVEDQAKSFLDSAVKVIKKEFKSRGGGVLKLSEQKDMSNYTVQKVSLNERYYYVSWRFFEIG